MNRFLPSVTISPATIAGAGLIEQVCDKFAVMIDHFPRLVVIKSANLRNDFCITDFPRWRRERDGKDTHTPTRGSAGLTRYSIFISELLKDCAPRESRTSS